MILYKVRMRLFVKIVWCGSLLLGAIACSKKEDVAATGTSASGTTKVTVVKIPDANFEQALIDLKIDSDATLNGQISTTDAQKATSFNISFKKIKDLTGIEGFTNLKELMIGYNALTTVDLSQNIALTRLVCHYNSLTGKLDLRKLTKLSSLDALGNPNLATICVNDVESAAANSNFQKDKTASFVVCP